MPVPALTEEQQSQRRRAEDAARTEPGDPVDVEP